MPKTNNQSTAIQLINANEERLKSVALRKDLSFPDWRNSALMLIQDTPDLMRCLETKGGQISLVNSLKMAAITRLPLLPTLGYASIIARYSKNDKEWHASYQLDKNGMVKLSSDAGYTVDSLVLHENDEVKEFTYGQFSDRLQVSPALRNPGPVIGYFARAIHTRKDNTQTLRVHYMELDQVLNHAIKTASSYEIRTLLTRIDRSKNIDDELIAIMDDRNVEYKLKQSSWIRFFHGMGEKTVVKALLGKPCFSNILNVAANAEEIQDNYIDDAGVITVEVVNEGNANTKRKIENKNNKNRGGNRTAPQNTGQHAPPEYDEVPFPEEPFE